MKKTLIYPYDEEFLPILEQWEYMQKIEVEKLVSPLGWGYAEKSYHIGCKKFSIEANYDVALQQCDTVWFVNSKIPLDFKKYILPKIEQALVANKQVLISRKMEKNEQELVNNLGKEIVIFPDTGFEIDYENFREEIFDFNIPIIFIMGLTQYTGKSFVQLGIWKELKKRNYNPSIVSAKKECQILGGYSIPDYMFSEEISEKEKILKFNHFVKSIEYKDKPELILINIPGEMLPVSRDFVGNFGVTAYEISQAVRPDCTIFNILYGRYSIDELIEIGKRATYRTGCSIDYYNIADCFLETERTKSEGRYVTVHLSKEFVKKHMLVSDKIRVFHLSEKEEIIKITDSIIDQLAENAFIQPL